MPMSIGMIRKRERERVAQQQLETKEETYICKECGKEYKTYRGLMAHLESKHGGDSNEL